MVYNIKHGIYAHPFELVACISTFLSCYGGIELIVNHPEFVDSQTSGILSMPRYILWLWIITGMIGGLVTAIGLTMSIWSKIGRVIETSGLWLMGSMWLTAGVARSALDLAAWVEYSRYFTIALGCVLRLMMIHDFHEIMARKIKGVDIE